MQRLSVSSRPPPTSPTRPRSTGSSNSSPTAPTPSSASGSPTPARSTRSRPSTRTSRSPSSTTRGWPAPPNVACLTFAEEQGSYLVGAVAALKSESGKVGFIGGVNVPLIQRFQAGYEAGVKATNRPSPSTPSTSPSRRTSPASTTPARARPSPRACTTAASTSSTPRPAGPVPVCSRRPRPVASRHRRRLRPVQLPSLADVKDVIITSMVKNVDVAVVRHDRVPANGEVLTGQKIYDLSTGGVGYATSGGAIDDIVPAAREDRGQDHRGRSQFRPPWADRRTQLRRYASRPRREKPAGAALLLGLPDRWTSLVPVCPTKRRKRDR